MVRIVIANSVGIDSKGYHIIHSPSRWSTGVKDKSNHFVYYPWELAYLSSLLKRETSHSVKFVDGCLLGLKKEEYLKVILEENPHFLVMEPSTRTVQDDLWVAKKVKEKIGAKLIFCGQHATALPQEMIQEGIDYVCQGEYEFTVLDILKKRKDMPGIYPEKRKALLDINTLPWPEDNDVKRIDYGTPGEPSSEYLEIQMYASRGCLRSCNFCVNRHLYYFRPCWRARDVEDIISEVKYLKDKYPQMEGVFFDEECHNGNTEFIKNLCFAIRKNKLDSLKFEAMCDLGLLNEEQMKEMFDTGYYMLRFGIENISLDVQRNLSKILNKTEIIQKLKKAKKIGLKTYATFLVGAPGSTIEKDTKTVDFMRELIQEGFLDNAQVSICTPLIGTPFYQWTLEKGYLDCEDLANYDGGNTAIVSYPNYSKIQIVKMKEYAFRARNRAIFLHRLKKVEIFEWFKKVYKKYGFWKTMRKLSRRLVQELLIPLTKIV
ncbi:MAG TPA: radical SAM protein [Candidatus Omnitrophica bacterium]|nr:radical SAM protein [Candidatus Omnitrophota bacterium]